jgi:cell division protein FtsB
MKISKEKVLHALKNKFVLTSVIFIVWMLFFDQNNVVERLRAYAEYRQLLSDKDYYQKKIEDDTRKLDELRTNNENLEKFAREQYLMKKDNEDIFIVEE